MIIVVLKWCEGAGKEDGESGKWVGGWGRGKGKGKIVVLNGEGEK